MKLNLISVSGSRMDMFHSNQSLHTRGGTAGTAITDQVIPELDEMQATVISMRKPESRPHMQDIFAIAVPTTPSPTIEGSKPIFIMGASAPHSPRGMSVESGASYDERSTLRPSDLQDAMESGLTEPSDMETLLLQPADASIKVVKPKESG
jgi:hypothetical protein